VRLKPSGRTFPTTRAWTSSTSTSSLPSMNARCAS
jgi:hypothetical protein